MGKKQTVPFVDIDRCLHIKDKIHKKNNLYEAFEAGYNNAPKGTTFEVDNYMYTFVLNNTKIYVDHTYGSYHVYLCNDYNGLFPRFLLASFKEAVNVKICIKKMQKFYDHITEVSFSEACL